MSALRLLQDESWPNTAPTMWHGMTAAVWYRLLRRNGFAVSRERLSRAALLTVISLVNSVLAAVARVRLCSNPDEMVIRRAPVIVLGHWRTGTTALHELLASHPDHVSPTTFQTIAPSHFLISERWLAPIVRRLLPSDRGFDTMRLEVDAPQEDEFAINALGLPSSLAFFGFANTLHQNHGDDAITALLGPEEGPFLQQWMGFLKAVQHGAPRSRLVLKNPAHLARIKIITEQLPDARFIHVVRHPYEVFVSTRRMVRKMIAAQGFQPGASQAQWLDEVLLATLPALYQRYWETEHLIPETNRLIVRNEDLRADPQAVLSTIHTKLGLATFDPNEAASRQALSYVNDRTISDCTLENEDRKKVAAAWGQYAERYGYAL